jgi:mycothiol synthase
VTRLPDGFTLRHTAPADIEAAQVMLDEIEGAETGEPRHSPLDIAADCQGRGRRLERDTWLVLAPNGDHAAFAFIFWDDAAQGEAEPFVHPRYRGLGLGDALLETIEKRASGLAAMAAPGVRPRLHVFCGENKVRRRRWLLDHGYRAVREGCLMRLDLEDEPPSPTPLPAGIELHGFVPGRDDEAVHAASHEAFAEHFLHMPSKLEEWRTRVFGRQGFDPALWLVAWDGDEVAGESLAYKDGDEGYVDSLSVRAPWRGGGLGLALLTSLFLVVHEQGMRKIRLGVDAQNPTGALALYIKAGMLVERREETYAKDLRQVSRGS